MTKSDGWFDGLSANAKQKVLWNAEVSNASRIMAETYSGAIPYDFETVRAAQAVLTQAGYDDILQHYADVKEGYGAAGIAYFWLLSAQNPASVLSLLGGFDMPAGTARGTTLPHIESFHALPGGRYALIGQKDANGLTNEYLIDRQGWTGNSRISVNTAQSMQLTSGHLTPQLMFQSANPTGSSVYVQPTSGTQWEVRDNNMNVAGMVEAATRAEAEQRGADLIRAQGNPYAEPAAPAPVTPSRPGTPTRMTYPDGRGSGGTSGDQTPDPNRSINPDLLNAARARFAQADVTDGSVFKDPPKDLQAAPVSSTAYQNANEISEKITLYITRIHNAYKSDTSLVIDDTEICTRYGIQVGVELKDGALLKLARRMKADAHVLHMVIQNNTQDITQIHDPEDIAMTPTFRNLLFNTNPELLTFQNSTPIDAAQEKYLIENNATNHQIDIVGKNKFTNLDKQYDDTYDPNTPFNQTMNYYFE